jgi:hypothetical protein
VLTIKLGRPAVTSSDVVPPLALLAVVSRSYLGAARPIGPDVQGVRLRVVPRQEVYIRPCNIVTMFLYVSLVVLTVTVGAFI